MKADVSKSRYSTECDCGKEVVITIRQTQSRKKFGVWVRCSQCNRVCNTTHDTDIPF